MQSVLLTTKQAKVLELLARKPGTSMYAIGKELRLASSSTFFVVRELEDRNLIHSLDTRKWRTGRPRKSLALTFVGCIFLLDQLEKRKTREPKIIRELADQYGQILDYPIFSEFQSINNALGGNGATTLCSLGSLLFRGIGEPPYCEWNSITFRTQVGKVRALRLEAEDEALRMKNDQERLWRNEYASLLLTWHLMHRRPMQNPRLNSFYRELLEDRIRQRRKDLEEARGLLHRLDSLFLP
jgi:hypothetical protein